jgi:hypothetical protein
MKFINGGFMIKLKKVLWFILMPFAVLYVAASHTIGYFMYIIGETADKSERFINNSDDKVHDFMRSLRNGR